MGNNVELMAACVHSLNAWTVDEWSFNYKDRLFACAYISLADVDLACQELDYALEHGVKVTGATLFVVDGGVDTGPIVAQVPVEVSEDDDVASLHERIKTAERAMLVDAVGRIAREGISVEGRRVRIGAVAR